MSLAKIQEPPERSLVLLVGPPGAGKSTFCHQIVLNSLAADRPVIFVTTERSASDMVGLLRERGMGSSMPGAMSFVDAFSQTVGVETPQRPDTISANCVDLNSISIATTRLQERIGRKGILLAFDSLTSPYLFSGAEVIKFMRLFLSKFAAEGNSVVAIVDEGCGKEEDLVAMMSLVDGIVRMAVKEGSRIIEVVKHPTVKPTEIRLPVTGSTAVPYHVLDTFWESHVRSSSVVRPEMGESVNLFWLSFTFWAGMLWDPSRFPTMLYNLSKETVYQGTRLIIDKHPWYVRLGVKLLSPKRLNNVETVKRAFPRAFGQHREAEGVGIFEYVDEISKTDEHYFRGYEGASCWGLENVGGPVCYGEAADVAGFFRAYEKEERDWNVVETACVGEGSPYCEFKAVPGELNELEARLTALDASIVRRIEDRLMEHVIGFVLHGKSLGTRPRLGSGIHTHVFAASLTLPALASERYRTALRMGGAKSGKEVGERLMNAGMGENEVIRRVVDFTNHCKVGKITLGETIKMNENCETFGLETGEPSCFFTTGFLNGLFSAVKDQHVREIKCIAAGDPYCEWEII